MPTEDRPESFEFNLQQQQYDLQHKRYLDDAHAAQYAALAPENNYPYHSWYNEPPIYEQYRTCPDDCYYRGLVSHYHQPYTGDPSAYDIKHPITTVNTPYDQFNTAKYNFDQRSDYDDLTSDLHDYDYGYSDHDYGDR